MERLTKRLEDGQAVLNCVECEVRGFLYCTVIGCRNRLKDRLAAYEDAEEQGLLVRLPCKVEEERDRIAFEARMVLEEQEESDEQS